MRLQTAELAYKYYGKLKRTVKYMCIAIFSKQQKPVVPLQLQQLLLLSKLQAKQRASSLGLVQLSQQVDGTATSVCA